jgi:predicted CXXCH cytochrome family protein
MSGTAVSPEIVAPTDAVSWGAFDWGAIVPQSTAVTTKVEGWNGSAWVVPTGMASITARRVDLSGLAAATYRKIRVTALLATTDYTQTPWLTGWTVSVLRQGRAYIAGSVDGGTACSSCHNVHALGAAGTAAWDLRRMSNPADTKRPMSSVAGGSVTSFCLTCHTGTPPRPGLPLGSVPATQAWGRAADRPLLTSMAKNEAGTAYSKSGHGVSTSGAIGCETCHDPHGSNNAELAAWTRPSWFTTGSPGARDNTTTAAHEENLCYQCHGNGTVGLQGPGAQDVASPASRAKGHPVATDGRHSNSESLAGLGSANRHSECTDCHDPHAAQPGVHTPGLSKAGPALRGAVGVRPTWSDTVFTTAVSYERVRFSGGPDELEAYLCFKCHTSATTQTSTNVVGGPGGTDLSKEFNPANQSFHNALGRATGVREYFDIGGTVYSWGWVGDSSLKNGLTHDSKLTCTDCHTSTVAGEARGPHGSSTPFMLDPAYDSGYETARLDHDYTYTGGVYPSNLICTKCHIFSLRVGEPGYNKVHGAANIYSVGHQSIPCIGCHVRVPHGSPRPRLLAYSTDPEPYKGVGWGDGYNAGTSGIKLKNYGPSSWVISDCEVGCSSTHEANPSSAPYWP